MNSGNLFSIIICLVISIQLSAQTGKEKPGAQNQDKTVYVKGVVLESDTKGNFKPLQGASINWLNTINGT